MKRQLRFLCISVGFSLLLTACGSPREQMEAVEAPSQLPATPELISPAPSQTVEMVQIEVRPSDTPGPSDTPVPTPEPTLTPAPTDTPVPIPDCLHGIDHLGELFTLGEPVVGEHDYSSQQVSIRITKHENPEGFPKPMVCFVADIYIEDITSFRTAWSQSTLKDSNRVPLDVLHIMAREKAILMINGDYACKWSFGCLVSNGEVARTVDNPRYDACVLLRDGTMLTFEGDKITSKEILELDPWQAWCFGPALLDDEGKAKTTFNSSLTGVNPRTALGYYAPGHYCFVIVDGRRDNYSKGMTLQQLSGFMASLGCRAAYNLDGGSSSVMAFEGRRVNKPSGIRKIPDVLYICEPRS